MDRVVAQLLAEIDSEQGGGANGAGDLFIIGATNRWGSTENQQSFCSL
jgi:hypothetical protein